MTSTIAKRFSLHQLLVQKQQENSTLKAQNTQLQALATLGSATCMIAHEINNLLTPLANYAALAAQNPGDKELSAKALDKTARSCRRASQIMQSMLALANGQKQEREEVAVKTMIEEVFTCLCRDFTKDRITVDMQIPESLRVRCVPVQIEQVLMNLILNAREAMLPGGGTLKVTAACAALCVQIAVGDTGRGIAAENLRNVFRPFFTTKAKMNHPADGSGSGVGLAFCRRIVEAHDGEITVESTLGQGTVFTIRLPNMPPQDR